MTEKSLAFRSPEGWRVELEAEGRKFISPVYSDKACAEASAAQQPDLLKLVRRVRSAGYISVDDFLDKAVSWFGWEETTEWNVEGNAAQIAITLRVKEEAIQSKNMFEQVKAFVIYDQAGLDLAATIIKDAKVRWKDIEAKRKEITKPLQAALKNVQALFKEPLDYYVSIETVLKEKILDAQARARAAQDAALQVAHMAHRVGDRVQTAISTHQAQAADVVNPQGLQNRSTWSFEVVNPGDVPAQFWMLNLQALGAFVRETKGTVPIPGVRVFEVQGLAVST